MIKHEPVEIIYAIETIFTGMWFLTVLFILSVIGAVIEKCCVKWKLLSWAFLFVLLNLLPAFWMRKELVFLMPFFVGSIYCSKMDWSKISPVIGIVSFAVFCAAFFLFSFEDTMYCMTDQVFTLEYHRSAALRFLIGLFGSIAILWLSRYLMIERKLSKPLIFLGSLTLPIYVLHPKFLLPNLMIGYQSDNIALYIITTAILLVLSFLCYRLLGYSKIIKFFLFGENDFAKSEKRN